MRLRFYFLLYWTALKARTEYRADFLVGVLTALSMQLASFAFFWVIFERAPTLGGWSPAEVLFLFGLTAMVLGLSEATFNGIWWLPWYIIDGQIDRVLVYPVNSLGFVLLSRPELHSLGNLCAGAVTLGIAWSLVTPPLWTILLLPIWIVCGAAIYTAVLVLMGALTFKLVGPWSTHMLAVHHLLNAARYPASIYPRWLGALILFVLPFGAAIFWPADFLRGQGSFWLALIAPPLAAVASLGVAWLSWNASIRGYQSTGS